MVLLAGALAAGLSVIRHRNSVDIQPEIELPERRAIRPNARDVPDIPAPPPPLPSSESERPRSIGQTGPELPPDYIPLAYDSTRSFATNLKRLREHCAAWPEATEYAQPLASFMTDLLSHAPGEFETVKNALSEEGGRNGYRCMLLAALMNCDGPARETADWVWEIAANDEEWPGVRHTAAYLTSIVDDSTPHTTELLSLLNDADDRVVVPALATAYRQMDRQAFDYISSELVKSPNIHIQVAAIHAISATPFSDEGQAKLKEIVQHMKTTRNDPLSESSLAKRKAVMHLDLGTPETFAMVLNIALDEEEESGVRAKAIGRFPLNANPNAGPWLQDLLAREVNDPLVFRAAVDALVTEPTPEIIAFIREQLERVEDLQMRDLLLKRITSPSKND